MANSLSRSAPVYEIDALATGLAKIKALPTDVGNARRLVGLFHQDIRYCPAFKKWFIWDGTRWVKDDAGKIVGYAKKTIKAMHRHTGTEEDDEKRKASAGWNFLSESLARIKAMIELAKDDPRIVVHPSELDSDPMKLGVESGTVDLRTGQHLIPSRTEYITKLAHVHFDSSAECPAWTEFVERIFNGDKELIAYHQRLCGYCLTGLTREQFIFIAFGRGANGKTVFWETIGTLMGDYAKTTPPETLMKRKNNGGPSPDLARLLGVRLALASEPDDGAVLNEALVKRITGQDTIACRHLYAEYFEFKPQFKTVLRTNDKPIIRSDSYATWRRMQLIPYTATIPEKDQDKKLTEKLQCELPGILNWALEGLRAYLAGGLEPPKSVRDAVAEYRSEMDILADWIGECLVKVDGVRTSVADLYDSYQTCCKASGHRPFGRKRLSQKLQLRGFESGRTGKGRYLVGLSLRPTPDKASLMDQTAVGPMGTG